MKNKLLPLFDKRLLRKHSRVETVNDQLKNSSQIEHSRHRSPFNFFVNLIAGLVAYETDPVLSARRALVGGGTPVGADRGARHA
jgi:hypothetical protein